MFYGTDMGSGKGTSVGAVRALTRSRLVSIKWCSVEMRLGILHMECLNIFYIFFDAFIPCFASLVLPYLLKAPLLHAVVISLFPHEFLSGIQDEVSYCLGGPICALWASLHPHHPQRSRSACWILSSVQVSGNLPLDEEERGYEISFERALNNC